MRIFIISDLHANLEALAALPCDYDELWVLGDLVNYGPYPAATIDFVRSHASVVIRGNTTIRWGSPLIVDALRASVRWRRRRATILRRSFLRRTGNTCTICLPACAANRWPELLLLPRDAFGSAL